LERRKREELTNFNLTKGGGGGWGRIEKRIGDRGADGWKKNKRNEGQKGGWVSKEKAEQGKKKGPEELKGNSEERHGDNNENMGSFKGQSGRGGPSEKAERTGAGKQKNQLRKVKEG